MKILYFGCLSYKEEGTEAYSAVGNNMQLGLLRELKKYFKSDIKVYSFMPQSSFPKDKVLIVPYGNVCTDDGFQIFNMGFINIFIIKEICALVNALIVMLLFCIGNRRERRVIMTGTVSVRFSLPLWLASKIFDVETVCLLVDAPVDILKGGSPIKATTRKIDNYLRERLLRSYDKYLTINKQMLSEYRIDKPCMQVYVGAAKIESSEKIVNASVEGKKEWNIIYTGTLEDHYSIRQAVTAASQMGDSYQFMVYGRGGLVDRLKSQTEAPNFTYMGYVANKEIRTIQSRADVLLCLLEPESYLGKNAFPGKIFEYMLSGTPVVSLRTPSIPEEMSPFLNFADSSDPQDIANAIMEVTKNADCYAKAIEKAKLGRGYVEINCSYATQAEKIYEFLNK